MARIGFALFAGLAFEEVAGIKLHAGLVGFYFQYTPGGGFFDLGNLTKLPSIAVEHVVVVVAVGMRF